MADSSGTTAYTYDDAGNTLTKGGGERQYSYDPAGRLTEINELGTNAHLGALRYNAHGQRFHAALAQENRWEVYHYDQDGRLIGEMDHSGSPVLREYVYLEGVPLAMFARRQASSGGGLLGDLLDPVTGSLLPVEVFYFHTGHLGTPRLLTDANGALVWQGQYQPFGNVTVTTEDVVNPLRFPGQRDDGTSGVYYNYFRDYDPATGRYVQSDPIGLNAGLNTYLYANAHPLAFIDPDGLVGFLLNEIKRGSHRIPRQDAQRISEFSNALLLTSTSIATLPQTASLAGMTARVGVSGTVGLCRAAGRTVDRNREQIRELCKNGFLAGSIFCGDMEEGRPPPKDVLKDFQRVEEITRRSRETLPYPMRQIK